MGANKTLPTLMSYDLGFGSQNTLNRPLWKVKKTKTMERTEKRRKKKRKTNFFIHFKIQTPRTFRLFRLFITVYISERRKKEQRNDIKLTLQRLMDDRNGLHLTSFIREWNGERKREFPKCLCNFGAKKNSDANRTSREPKEALNFVYRHLMLWYYIDLCSANNTNINTFKLYLWLNTV